MILADFHCHTNFVDGNHSAEEIVLSAIEKGIKTLGVSEHAYVPFDLEYSLSPEQTLAYRNEIARLKEKYKNQIELLCGIEMDYYSIDDPNAYDYVIGSVHYLTVNGNTYSVDMSPEETIRCIQKEFQGDAYEYAAFYFNLVGDLKEKWNPDIIGHFDLITKFQDRGICFNSNNPVYHQAAVEAIMKLTGSTFEVNTGAISRGYRKEAYPEKQWIHLINEMGGAVVLSSDSHHKDTLLFQFDSVEELLKKEGIGSAGFIDRKGKKHIQF